MNRNQFNKIFSFFTLLIINGFISVSAQTFSSEFGKITAADIDYTDCDFDKGAEAVVFFDIGNHKFPAK